MNKILITRRQGQVLTALWDGSRVLEFVTEAEDEELHVGDIYLGRVSSVVKNIGAAFVEVLPGRNCFLPLRPEQRKQVHAGDELPVILTREAVKTKDPVVSTALSLNGRYLVLLTDKKQIAISSRIREPERREALKAALADYPAREGVGFIVRTNARELPENTLREEAERLLLEYRKILSEAAHRTLFSRIRSGAPSWLLAARDAASGSVEAVITDQRDIWEELCSSEDFLEAFGDREPELYEDSYPLEKLYRLEHFLEMALNRRVWLKSGGYLVIDITEAMTVIDVNTGKYDGHKGKEETILRTNLEAAEEIAFQLRLRNLSGIVLVDFIDMGSPEHRQKLTEALQAALGKDPQRALLVDFTALGLAEITRKKVRRPLQESLKRQGRVG